MLLRLRRHSPRGPNDGLLWRGWLRLGNRHQIQLGLHLFFVLTLMGVTSLLAQLFLPRLFPGWPLGAYWLVATTVAVTDSLAGLLHEFGHAAVAIARGRRVHRITLYGLVASAQRSSGLVRPRDQLLIAVAGPVSHLLLAVALWGAWNALPNDNEPLRVAAGWPAVSNFVVGVLNLLPVLPLDGGRVVRALLAGALRV